MFRQKTHFEQVSLETVRKIVEEQIRKETRTENDQEAQNNAVKEIPSGAEDQSIAWSRALSERENWEPW